MGSDCSTCSTCKGGAPNEIKTQNDDMTSGARGQSGYEDGEVSSQSQPKNIQSKSKDLKKTPNSKEDATGGAGVNKIASYVDANEYPKDEKGEKSPPMISKSAQPTSLAEPAVATGPSNQQAKPTEEIQQEATRLDTNNGEKEMNQSGSQKSKKKNQYQNQPIEAHPLAAVPQRTDQPAVRENRPAYQFKSGAIYDGQWIGNMRDGFGVQTWTDGARYEGEWKDNKAHGRGKFWHVDGDVFEGEWQDDKANGQGTYMHVNGAKYEGAWKDDLQDGFGVETWADGSKYEGNYKEGKKHGQGTYTWSDQSKYVGEWVENRISGKGTYTWLDGRKYDGDWLNNNMHGKGVYTWKDGRRYEGEYQYDKKHGFGIYMWADGRRYEGFWGYGKQHGKGKYILPDNSVKIGLWEDGKRMKWLENETGQDIKPSDKSTTQINIPNDNKNSNNDTTNKEKQE